MKGGSSARLARYLAAMVSTLSAATVLFAVAPAARAEVAAADPIDTGMRTCLARADRSSTAGQIQCMDDARSAWRTAADTALVQLHDSGKYNDIAKKYFPIDLWPH